MKELNKEYSEWEYEEEEEEEEHLDENSSEEDDEDQDSDDSKVEIEIDGKKQEVSLDELKKGYMRQSDYTRKTQELSNKDKEKVIDKAQDVVDNKDDYPEEDVKTAEYLIKIAKDKLGLLTRDEYEAEKQQEKQISELENSFSELSKETSKMKGMPKVDKDELLEYMKETGIHNPKSAYLTKYDSEYRDYIVKQSKGNTSYRSDKGGKKTEPKSKDVDINTEEGHRSFLLDEIAKMNN